MVSLNSVFLDGGDHIHIFFVAGPDIGLNNLLRCSNSYYSYGIEEG